MNNPFKNDINMEDNLWIDALMATAALALTSTVATSLGLVFFENYLYLLWALGLIPFAVLASMYRSNIGWRLTTDQYSLYRLQNELPAELKAEVSLLDEETIAHLSGNEITAMMSKLGHLLSLYETQQEMIRRPKVNNIFDNLDAIIDSYASVNETMKELG